MFHSGCQGNKNKFVTRDECRRQCELKERRTENEVGGRAGEGNGSERGGNSMEISSNNVEKVLEKRAKKDYDDHGANR